MVYYDTAWPIDYLFIAPKGRPVMNLPLMEVIPGALLPRHTSDAQFAVINKEAKQDEPKETLYQREVFLKTLTAKLKVGDIEAFSLQPEGESTVSEVHQFLEKYDKH